MGLPYHVDQLPAVNRQAIIDSAEPLGRLFQEERGEMLDVDATLDRTVRRAGRFSPVSVPRKLRQEVLVLIDREEGDFPWLGPFRRLVAAWASQGVPLKVFEIEGGYSFLEVSPREPEEELGGDPLTLAELTRQVGGLPLVVFCRRLDHMSFKEESPWHAALLNWPCRAWIDPDPRPLEERPSPEKEEIGKWELEGLRRFPLTADGVTRLAWYLAGLAPGRSADPLMLPLPKRPHGAGQGGPMAEGLRLWALAAALVPDATWDQLEAIRCHFPEIWESLPDGRYIQRLLEWMAREMGGSAHTLSQYRRLAVPEERVDSWIREQRSLDVDLPKEKRFESRVRLLLVRRRGSPPPPPP
ncbi:MAG: hypothetical protein KDD47_21235, partial [Acidobacteria bacterium]|nr:hypothetical protein [Acidobacteriota bacterium]